MRYELAFLGAGHMAEAIAKAAIQQRVLQAPQLIASDPNPQRRAVFTGLGIATASDNAQVIGQTKQVLVAVKPQVMAQAAADLGRFGSSDQVILSIMAGISIEKLSQAVVASQRIDRPRVIRIMPNTPLQVGFGMTAIAPGPHTQPGDTELATCLFAAAGRVIQVDESKLDAVTAVSGSGPAYVFYLAEAMQRVADELGLGEHGDLLVGQTVLGAAHLMMATSGQGGPAALRRKVTSPGGTTEAAIQSLEDQHAADIIAAAVRAAAERSAALGHTT